MTFSEKWVPEYLQVTMKDGWLKLDWAHRYSATKPSPNQRPRPLDSFITFGINNEQLRQRIGLALVNPIKMTPHQEYPKAPFALQG